jgi:hypothetical protein
MIPRWGFSFIDVMIAFSPKKWVVAIPALHEELTHAHYRGLSGKLRCPVTGVNSS